MTPEECVLKFASDELRIGEGEMTGDEMIEAFNRWWCSRWLQEQPMRPRDFSPILTKKAGIERKRSGGRSRYVASLVSCHT